MPLRNIIPLACCMFLLFSANTVKGTIGVNWGRMSYQRLVPSMVVDLFLQNGITEVKVFSNSDNVMKAFSRTGIGLTISIPNESLFKINSTETAQDWVRNKVIKYLDQQVYIKYIYTGLEPFSPSITNNTHYIAINVLKYIQGALNALGCRETKATFPHLTDVMKWTNQTKPSHAEFRDDIMEKMIEVFEILRENNSPIFLDILPFVFVNENNLDMEFAFVDGNPTYFVEDDNGLKYTNAFDFLYDSFLWSMKKVGASDVKLVVGQIGWPTDGYPGANIVNAERFYKSFLPKVVGNRGTPLLPGAPIDIYIHALTDESKYRLDYGAYQRHWGIYRNDGKPKFKIDLSGQGRDIYPPPGRGVTNMPKRWCVYKGDETNLTKVKNEFDFACNYSDCTSLMPGGSCSDLDLVKNVSYAFNRYFQKEFQRVDKGACSFNGLGEVVPDDPSTSTCPFPVEILQAEDIDLGISNGVNTRRVHAVSKLVKVLLLLLVLAFAKDGS